MNNNNDNWSWSEEELRAVVVNAKSGRSKRNDCNVIDHRYREEHVDLYTFIYILPVSPTYKSIYIYIYDDDHDHDDDYY